MATLPASVLFACNLNRVRSPMAEALARRLSGGALFTDSCGLSAPDGADPFLAVVMHEIGIDLSERRPKTFDELQDGGFDLVISLTPEAHRRAVEMTRRRAVAVEYWPTADPTLASGSREQRLDAYRAVRDDLSRRLAERFGRPSTLDGGSG
jgi:protein-tyrosine-phosphatase